MVIDRDKPSENTFFDYLHNDFHNLNAVGIKGRTMPLVQYDYKSGNGRLKQVFYANNDNMKATYNALGQLVAEKWYDANEVLTAHYQYGYDGQGNIARTLDNFAQREYTYSYEAGVLDGAKILRETWGINELVPLYDNEDSVCGILYNQVPYYFRKNLQGYIIAITDKYGETVARYTYDAWGKCTIVDLARAHEIATVNPFRYRGYYYDSETQLYYLQSRYYDPTLGRFINGDKVMGANNDFATYQLYAYCGNCPIDRYDAGGCLNGWRQNLHSKQEDYYEKSNSEPAGYGVFVL